MGALLLKHKTAKISQEKILSSFLSQNLSKYYKVNVRDYQIWVFKRNLALGNNYYENGNDGIFLSGTLIYKNKSQQESMKAFLFDFIQEDLSCDSIIGQFSIVLKVDGVLYLITDRSGISNVYYNDSKTIISTSFLAVSMAERNLKLNKLAITEILLTGGLIGPDTIFENVKRLEQKENIEFPSINIIKLPPVDYELGNKSRSSLINEQLDRLDYYFSSISKLANEQGVTLGLTGGFDSRLMMCFAERHFENIEYFSHWRKRKTKELIIAERLAKAVNKKLNIYEVIHPLDMSEEEAWNTLDKGFYHYDGHIRTQAYWHEAYNTLDYLKMVYQNNYLGLHAIGGEQYRNYERMIWPRWNYHSWLKHEVLYRFSENIFFSKADEKNFIDYYSSKICHKLNLGQKNYINRMTLKRFHNEVYNLANRAVRSSMENKSVFFLCPFADPLVSYKAYEIVPKLGPSLSFQADMIKKISPRLAKIESEYGFNFFDGENFRSVLNGYIKEAMPKKLFFNFYHYRKKTRKNTFYFQYRKRHHFMSELDDLVDNLPLNIETKRLKNIKDTGWLLISLGYFLKKMKTKVSI